MRGTLLTLVLPVYLIADVFGQCKISEKKLNKEVKHYEKKCLKKGFASSLAGCKSKGSQNGMKKKHIRKCAKKEKILDACGFNCLVEVGGGWGDYGDWSVCSEECGGGEQTRERMCNNPAPENGGADCEGDSSETQSCNEHPCPVDGVFGEWTGWSECTAECAGGTQSRSRDCNNPAPANGGAECDGLSAEVQACNEQPCPVDGGWGDYGDWSVCSEECGGGEQARERMCNNPAPENGGADCQGDSSETQSCNEHPCPVDGVFGEWTDWSECSAKCDGGLHSRSRECNDPAPANGGADCQGAAAETQLCNEQACPVDGEYGEWTVWSVCTAECDRGTQSRTRECDSPAPANGGAECAGEPTQTQGCNEHPCPVDGVFGEWTGWSECSAKCAGGTQSRTRDCNNPAPANGGAECDGLSAEVQACNEQRCGVKYVITHKTGTGTWDAGKTSGGYLITLTGSDGKTSPHDCVADRGKGVIASCTFNDPVNIGTVTGMTVENISDDQWGFNWVKVTVNGQFKAKWRGSKTVEDYTTRAIVFTPIGDMVDYEITHVTGTGKYDSGGSLGYKFTLKGDGPYFTKWADCEADRSAGATGSCVISDRGIIGTPKEVWIKNEGSNQWVFKSFIVKVNGQVVAEWSGHKVVPDYKRVIVVFQ